MNSKKMYRIELVNDFTYLTQQLVLMAARSNGGDYKPIGELKAVAETLQLSNPDYIVEQIGDNILHIDYKKGDKYLHALRLEEVELMQLLDEDAPTLNRQVIGIKITKENENTLHY
jgi:hypothetical protein